MVRTLSLFAVVRRGLRGLVAPLCVMLLLCASAPGQGQTLTLAGSLAQIASAGGWDISFTLVNFGTAAGEARLDFYANDGSPLPLPFTFPLQPALAGTVGSTINENIGPNALVMLDTTGPISQAVAVGSSQLLTSGNIAGFGTFTFTPSGQAAVVPLETRDASSYVLSFDNTSGLATGVAIANLVSAAASVRVVIRDDTGAQISSSGTTISLAGYGHTSFMLTDPVLGFPVTANIRGTIEFDTPQGGQISVLGLRANGNALTSLPVLANVGTGGGTMAHVASGGGWQTLFTLVNTGTAAANVMLSFFDDGGGALSLPVSFPQTGTVATEPLVSQVIPAGATLLVVTQGQNSTGVVTGSAQLSTTGNVSGFAIFQNAGQEAVVPLEAGSANTYTLAFDNTSGLVTGVALANSADQAAAVPLTLRDSTGETLTATTINLPANGHRSQVLTDLFPQAANIRGTLEFDTPAGGQIGALGIRATPAGAYTTIPVMTTGTSGDVVAQRELAQTGLAIALASTVLQSQVTILDALLGEAPSCVPLNGGGSVVTGASGETVTVYYDTGCTKPYIFAQPTNGNLGNSSNGGVVVDISETATYYGLSGAVIGTLTLNETAEDSSAGAVNVFGLGIFTPAGSPHTPVQLGLYCAFASSTATTAQCGGGIAQNFPALGLAIGAVTPLAITLSAPPPFLQLATPTTGGVTFVGGGPAVTGPIGSLTLLNPTPTALIIQGGTAYASTTSSGGAAAFSLFPPTPTSWTVTDSFHDQKFQISVVNNTTRNLNLTVVQTSTGSTLATGSVDQSGSGTITYSDGSVAAITSWTLAD